MSTLPFEIDGNGEDGGFERQFQVPVGVTKIKIEVWGAGSGGDVSPSLGGYCSAFFQVLPGDILLVCAPKAGGSPLAPSPTSTTGFFGGGGAYVRKFGSPAQISSAMLVAGGAGGLGVTRNNGATTFITGGTGGGAIGGNGGDRGIDGKGGNTNLSMPGAGGFGGTPGNSGILGSGGMSVEVGFVAGSGAGGGGYWGGGSGAVFGVPDQFLAGIGGGGSGGFPLGIHDMIMPFVNVKPGGVGYVLSPTNNDFGFVKITNATPLCVSETTLVSTIIDDCLYEFAIGSVPSKAKAIDSNGEHVPIKHVVKFISPETELIYIERATLGFNCPEQPLYIKPGHPLWINNQEILPEELIASGIAQYVKMETPVFVYCLVTERRTFVRMQGLHVATWSEAAFENLVANNYLSNFEYVN